MSPPEWFPVSVVSRSYTRYAPARIKGHGNHGNKPPCGTNPVAA